jgi:acetyltransferase
MSRSAPRPGAVRPTVPTADGFDPIGPSGRAVGPITRMRGGGYGGTMEPIRAILPLAPIDASHPSRDGVRVARAQRKATIIRIRGIAPSDHDALRDFYAGLSDQSRRTRFLGSTSGIGDAQSTYFCCPDHAHREGFVALVGSAAGPDRIVGHVCVEPDGRAGAEIAVAVADELQGRGIGRRLVDAAVAWARRDGIRTLTATMLADNPPIQRLLTSLGLSSDAIPLGAGVIEIRIDLGVVRSAA